MTENEEMLYGILGRDIAELDNLTYLNEIWDERDRHIIGFRLIGYTRQDIATMFGISSSRVGQIEDRAWARLRYKLGRAYRNLKTKQQFNEMVRNRR